MKSLKLLIAAAGLITLASIIVYQQARMDRLAAEAATLRDQVQQQAAAHNEPETPPKPHLDEEVRSNSAPPLSGEQFSELLRLRGEVGVLRRQLADALERASKERSKRPPWQDQMTPEQAISWEKAKDSEGKARLRIIANNALEELAKALNVPESVSKITAQEGLRDKRLEQYWPYLYFKAHCEDVQAFFEGHEGQARSNGSAQ